MMVILGTPFYKQALVFYTVANNYLPKGLHYSVVEKMQNLIVILTRDLNVMVTCYYTNNAMKYLKKKQKYLR